MQKSDVDIKKIPDEPGVYKFVRADGVVLYVGKATSLRDRVKSYFASNIAQIRSPLIEKVVRDASSVEVQVTDSVLEALILEAQLIKNLQPHGNTDNKDNKSFSFLVVTDEEFPRFMVSRERELSAEFAPSTVKKIYGPFTSAQQLREALKIVRKIFPFFDSPFRVSGELTHSQKKHLSFNQSIGLYPRELNHEEYAKSVRYLTRFFDGKKQSLLKTLHKEMGKAARAERFEEAAILKRQIFSLTHIRDLSLIKDEYKLPQTAMFRIEAYDIAHSKGEAPRGVMTVVIDGEKSPKDYRTFTIRRAASGDDIAALSEVIERRAKHREWSYPQLIVIDGGATHLKHAKQLIRYVGMDADVVSVVKDEKHKPKNILGSSTARHTHEDSILLANAEAHRYAIGRHRYVMRRNRVVNSISQRNSNHKFEVH